jgi:hypothetical protein
MIIERYEALHAAAYYYPAIDNHAHPLLKEESRHAIPFEVLISEADEGGLKDAVHTMACFRATEQLGRIFDIRDSSWDKIKAKRKDHDYSHLCKLFMDKSNIQCIMLDDGLGGVAELALPWKEHNKFCTVKRISRIEVEAEVSIT